MLDNATSTDIIKIIDHMKDIITPIGAEVYKIYYKQMILTGIFETIIDLVILIVIPYLAYYIIKHKDEFSRVYDTIERYDLEFGISISIIILVIAVLMLFITALDGIPEDIMHILNPDYYIIQNLLHG